MQLLLGGAPVTKALDTEALQVVIIKILQNIAIYVIFSNYALVLSRLGTKLVAAVADKFLHLLHAPVRLQNNTGYLTLCMAERQEPGS